MTPFPLILGSIAGCISLILSIFVYRIYLSTKIKASLFIFTSFCIITLNSFTFSSISLVTQYNEILAYAVYLILIFTGVFALLIFSIFFDYIELGRINTLITFLFGFVIGAFLGVILLPGQISLEYNTTFSMWMINLSYYSRVLVLIFGLLVCYRLLKGYSKIYNLAMDQKLKFQFKMIYLGLILSLFGLFISSASGILLSHVNMFIGSIVRGVYPIFISIGLFCAVLGMKKNPYSMYLISQKIFQIIVFNKEGVTIYDQLITESESRQSTLVTGAIFGVSTMIKHALGIVSPPRSLEFDGRTLIFVFHDEIGFALISDKDSKILRNGLKNFSDLFMRAYKNDLEHWNGKLEIFKDAFSYMKKAFPFLDISST
jgi:hypothetical protein